MNVTRCNVEMEVEDSGRSTDVLWMLDGNGELNELVEGEMNMLLFQWVDVEIVGGWKWILFYGRKWMVGLNC